MRVTTLDERTLALLERLEALCAGGGYHILEAADLAPFSAEEAGQALICLSDARCVEIRYAENGTYCLRVLPAGRAYVAYARERAREARISRRRNALFAFFGALAGGFFGSLLAVLLVGG